MEIKKIAAAAAVGAAFLMVGTPAFASQGYEMSDVHNYVAEYDHTHQVGLVNLSDSEILSDINVCHVDVNVIAVPILSNNDSGLCANPDVETHVTHIDED